MSWGSGFRFDLRQRGVLEDEEDAASSSSSLDLSEGFKMMKS